MNKHYHSDSSSKFIGMDVPRGCGCSSVLFIAFIIICFLAAILGNR